MGIFQWVLQESESALAVVNSQSSNTELLLTYFICSILIRKSQLIAAFFISCLFFECSLFDSYSEAQLYLLTFVTYTYVITCNAFSVKTKLACVIMCLLCLVFAYDAAFYGVNGFYGVRETIIYNNIEHLFVCCHILIICTTVDVKRISNAIKSFCYSISHFTRNSACFTIL